MCDGLGPRARGLRTRSAMFRQRKMEEGMFSELVPGTLVRHPERADWGIGQVQSVDGNRITVNFEHAGKHLINIAVITLRTLEADPRR